ncbi:MAG TPA: metallopeptidase family protein [Polyangia bacterium]|jgi:tetratricopeptide (TPR) repeat protein
MMRARWLALLVASVSAGGFACRSAVLPASKAEAPVAAPAIPPSSVAGAEPEEPPPRPLRRCFPNQPTWEEAAVADLLDRAGKLFDADDFEGALACSEEAARQAPRSIEAHHDRAAALLHLGKTDEGRDALAMALALDPDDTETLEASADLYINQLPASADRSAIGLEHARRAFRRALGHDRTRAARLSLLEGQALIDLGRSEEAVHRLSVALSLAPKLDAAQYEKGVALFELCRFGEARRAFEKVAASSSDRAHALYHLGLIEERQDRARDAESHFSEATERDPIAFPRPPDVSAVEFAERVRRIVGDLPEDVRADLAQAHLETADLPALDDLIAEKPPLSPTILGLFRGLPIGFDGEAENHTAPATRAAKGRRAANAAGAPSPAPSGGEPSPAAPTQCGPIDRAIVLYRRNLLRSVRDTVALDEAIRRTLLHELGHLRGEDDGSLRDRGLE